MAQLCWIYDYLYVQDNDYVLGHMGFAVFFTFIRKLLKCQLQKLNNLNTVHLFKPEGFSLFPMQQVSKVEGFQY